MKAIDFDYFLDIDIVSGRCFWKSTVSKHHRELTGKEAGCVQLSSKDAPRRTRKEYWVVRINKKGYKRSHIIFWKKHGRMPKKVIDHINGDSLDDRSENLREVSCQINSQNRRIGYNGRRLPIGVRKGYVGQSGICKSFQARIIHNGKMIHLGSYNTPEEASKEYLSKREELMSCVL